MKVKPKDGEPHAKQANGKSAYWCDRHERWTFQKGHTTEICRGRLRKEAQAQARTQSQATATSPGSGPTLRANLAALLQDTEEVFYSPAFIGLVFAQPLRLSKTHQAMHPTLMH